MCKEYKGQVMNKYIAILNILFFLPALAWATPQSLGREGAWEAVQDTDRNTCYMLSFPLRSEGDYTKRDAAYFMVTIRPNENVVGEIAFYAGYPYGSKPVEVTIGSKKYNLVPNGEWAWTLNKEEDNTLLNAMIGGNQLIVKGYSKKGTLTTDTFSLSGVTASWRKVKAACNN